jgi:hypothetical protein
MFLDDHPQKHVLQVQKMRVRMGPQSPRATCHVPQVQEALLGCFGWEAEEGAAEEVQMIGCSYCRVPIDKCQCPLAAERRLVIWQCAFCKDETELSVCAWTGCGKRACFRHFREVWEGRVYCVDHWRAE